MVETDVVVLGSGAGGLSAALTAAVGGAQITVLEAAPVFGGTTAISGGGMWLPGNTLDPDYTEPLDDAKTYLKKLTLGLVSDEIIDRFLSEAGSVPTFFAEHTALEFHADIGRPDYFAPWEGSSLTSRTVFPGPYELPRLGELTGKVRKPGAGGILPIQHEEERRYGTRPDGDHMNELDLDSINKLIEDRLARNVVLRGRALVGGLMEGCLDHGAQFVSDARARSLIVEDGRVVGVRAEVDGQEVEYRARYGVVIATGGFEWNRDLWDRFLGVPYDGPATPPWNRGDGLIMASQAGAKLGNLDKATWCPSSYFGEEYDGHPYLQGRAEGQHVGEILVNRKGRRFVNETLPYNDIGRVFTRFDPQTYEWENHPCFMIGDRHSLEALESPPVTAYAFTNDPNKPKYTAESGDGWVRGDTVREVAEKLGIDPDGLEQQIAEWNEHAVTGVDPVFHRAERPWEVHNLPGRKSIGPIVEGPFVGHRVRASVFGTRGGPMINQNAQIVDYSDEPIPGLYGAGNAIAHPFAHVYPGGGGTLGPAMTFGHIAGKSLLEDNGLQAPHATGVLEGAAS
jgi:succinate dehydrogenase/fumarate reductase flavoprotein subunit